MRGLPVTLWRFIFIDLWRLMALAAGVLVVVIAFAATIKPLSEGRLEAADALKFMAYAMPPMLAYALPFAAGFSATLVYHRMATDNETIAAHAGGLSHSRVLMPATITAIILSLTVLALNDQVIPRFLRRMQQMITVDVSRLIASEVARGNAVQQKNLIIFADSGKSFGPDPASGALDRVVLGRFAAIELDRDGTPSTEASSKIATLWLFPGDDSAGTDEPNNAGSLSRVVMRLQDVVALKQNEWTTGSKDTVLRWNVPDMFKDSPAFLTYGELRSLHDEPARMSGINFPRRDLAILLAERDARARLEQLATSKGQFTLEDSRGKQVVVRAGGFKWDQRGLRILPPNGKQEVEVQLVRGVDNKAAVEMIIASPDAYLITDMGEDRSTRRLEFKLDFLRARTRELGAGALPNDGSQRGDLLISNLLMPAADGSPFLAPYLSMSTAKTLAAAAERADDDFVTKSAVELKRKIRNLERGVMAKIHERLALSLTCGLAILLGAVAAVNMSSRTPLAIYLWSFLPAMGAIVTIQGGTQVVKSSGEMGLFLLWSSVAGLALYTGVQFRALTRH